MAGSRRTASGLDLFEQLEPFRAHSVFVQDETSGVAAWPRQTFDEAGADWVDDIHEHNRHSAS
jgi:hypothetical protein